MRPECDRSGCARNAIVAIRFQPHGHWWHYCHDHVWPLDPDDMTWGARGKRARRQPVVDIEWYDR